MTANSETLRAAVDEYLEACGSEGDFRTAVDGLIEAVADTGLEESVARQLLLNSKRDGERMLREAREQDDADLAEVAREQIAAAGSALRRLKLVWEVTREEEVTHYGAIIQ